MGNSHNLDTIVITKAINMNETSFNREIEGLRYVKLQEIIIGSLNFFI